jgi:hypothetical protein
MPEFGQGGIVTRIRVASACLVTALLLAPAPAHAQSGGSNLNLTQIAARVAALEAALAAEVSNRVGAVAAEISARAAADTTLQNNITAEFNGRVGAVAQEISDRQVADTTLQNNITAEFNGRVGAVAAEINARQAADTTLQEQVNKLKGNNLTASDLEGNYNFYFVATAIDSGPNTITSYFYRGTMTLGSGGTGHLDVSAAGSQLKEQAPNLNWVATNVGASQVGNISWAYSNGVVTITGGGDSNDLTPAAGGQVMVGVQGGPPGNNQAILVVTRQP